MNKAERVITDLREASANLLDRAILADGQVRHTTDNLGILEARGRVNEEDLIAAVRQDLHDAQGVCRGLRWEAQDLFDSVAQTLATMGYDSTYRDENGFSAPLPDWAKAINQITMDADRLLWRSQAEGLF